MYLSICLSVCLHLSVFAQISNRSMEGGSHPWYVFIGHPIPRDSDKNHSLVLVNKCAVLCYCILHCTVLQCNIYYIALYMLKFINDYTPSAEQTFVVSSGYDYTLCSIKFKALLYYCITVFCYGIITVSKALLSINICS